MGPINHHFSQLFLRDVCLAFFSSVGCIFSVSDRDNDSFALSNGIEPFAVFLYMWRGTTGWRAGSTKIIHQAAGRRKTQPAVKSLSFIVGRCAQVQDVMWVSHLCGSSRCVGFVPERRGVRSEPALYAGRKERSQVK